MQAIEGHVLGRPADLLPLSDDLSFCRLVEKYGEGQWSLISTFFPGRIGKQCRERWHHQLNPKINRNAWNMEEEKIIVAAHKVWPRWLHLYTLI